MNMNEAVSKTKISGATLNNEYEWSCLKNKNKWSKMRKYFKGNSSALLQKKKSDNA